MILHKYSVPLDDPCCYPLGYMYVASHLRALGHNVKMLNYNLYGYDLRYELKNIDLVCFTGFEEFKERIISDSILCKELGIKTIVGGALSTFGEFNNEELPDIKFIGEIDRDVDIDRIPLPDYEIIDIKEYHNRHQLKYMGVLASRGCPFNCRFCAQTCTYRERSVQNVIDEIDLYIKKYNVEFIAFNDNTLNVTKSRFMNICSEMSGKCNWGAAIRCHPFDEEMAIAAKNSGCSKLIVGVESFNQAKLNMMNKQIKVKHIIKTLDLLNKHNLGYYGNLLLGFEGETVDMILNELYSIPGKYNIFPTFVQPFAGTQCGYNRAITKEAYDKINSYCINYCHQKGMYTYSGDNDGGGLNVNYQRSDNT